MPNRSPAARAAGTTAHPGCDCDGACESSVSSACANTPFVIAASIGPHTIFEATTVATSLPPYTPANCIAARPGVNSEPEIIAANVSRICCFVFSVASSGNSRPLASLMYALSLSMTGLTPCPVVPRLGDGLAITIPGGSAAVATARPANSNRLRRERIVWPFSAGPYLFRFSLMHSPFYATLLSPDLAQRLFGTTCLSAPWNYVTPKIRDLKTELI